ncbi:MAG: BamA/TamA family outer membrane protein [Nodosilinea sp.]
MSFEQPVDSGQLTNSGQLDIEAWADSLTVPTAKILAVKGDLPLSQVGPGSLLVQGDTAADAGSAEVPVYLRPNSRGRLRLPVDAGTNFIYGFGSVLQEPHGLRGPTRDRTTTAQVERTGSIFIPIYGGVRLGPHQALLAQTSVGLAALDLDLSYFYAPPSLPGILSANLVSQRSQNPTYNTGVDGPEVGLPNGNRPWVHRLGGGVQYAYPVNDHIDLALAANYQRVSARDGLFSSRVTPTDSQGNPLTVSPTGQDDLLTLHASLFLNSVTGRAYSLAGSRLRLGLEQAIPVGRASLGYTRLVANGAQFIPLSLVRQGDYIDTLVFNLQGGVTLGQVPPYEAFILGGINTVRGYALGEVASGRHFLTATAEYRVPLATANLFDFELPIAGLLFVDYGTTFGSDATVVGTPGPVRGKPGYGLGYGLGVLSFTPFGIVRLEYGRNLEGGDQVHVTVGSRF